MLGLETQARSNTHKISSLETRNLLATTRSMEPQLPELLSQLTLTTLPLLPTG